MARKRKGSRDQLPLLPIHFGNFNLAPGLPEGLPTQYAVHFQLLCRDRSGDAEGVVGGDVGVLFAVDGQGGELPDVVGDADVLSPSGALAISALGAYQPGVVGVAQLGVAFVVVADLGVIPDADGSEQAGVRALVDERIDPGAVRILFNGLEIALGRGELTDMHPVAAFDSDGAVLAHVGDGGVDGEKRDAQQQRHGPDAGKRLVVWSSRVPPESSKHSPGRAPSETWDPVTGSRVASGAASRTGIPISVDLDAKAVGPVEGEVERIGVAEVDDPRPAVREEQGKAG